MKKIIITILVALVGFTAVAQENVFNKTKSFLKLFQYTISVGYGSTVSNEPFDTPGLTLNAGLDVQRDFMSIKEGKYNTYGLLGVHYTSKGGKLGSSVDDWMSSGNKFLVSQFTVPIHVGFKFNFKKSYLFVDAGPYLSFNRGTSISEGYGRDYYVIDPYPVESGVGINMGICFKKFGLSAGIDKGLTNLAKYIEDEDRPEEYTNLKSMAAYLRLQWTFNR